LYPFFWVIPRRLNFMCRSFGTLCLFQGTDRVWVFCSIEQTERECYVPWNWQIVSVVFHETDRVWVFCSMEQCSETSAYKIQTSGNYPEEITQRSDHAKVWKQEHFTCFPMKQTEMLCLKFKPVGISYSTVSRSCFPISLTAFVFRPVLWHFPASWSRCLKTFARYLRDGRWTVHMVLTDWVGHSTATYRSHLTHGLIGSRLLHWWVFI